MPIIWLYKINVAIAICKIKVIHKMILVIGLGWISKLSLLVRYIAPILIIGSPSAAQIPAINKRVIGLGSKK